MSSRKSTVKAGCSVFVGAALVALLGGASREANAQIRIPPGAFAGVGTEIKLACSNPGSQQDVAKTPILKNTTGATIPKGYSVSWSSSDRDGGTIKLAADLPVNAEIRGQGKPGQAYSCTSSFFTRPDLVIKKATFQGASSASFELANVDPFVDAGKSIARVEVVSCSNNAVLASAETWGVAVAKGESVPLTLSFSPTSGKRYLRVRADAKASVSERIETNNVWDSQNSCLY